MLSEALQRNAKHKARLSNISDLWHAGSSCERSEILRFAQNDITTGVLFEYFIAGGLVMRHVVHVMAQL